MSQMNPIVIDPALLAETAQAALQGSVQESPSQQGSVQESPSQQGSVQESPLQDGLLDSAQPQRRAIYSWTEDAKDALIAALQQALVQGHRTDTGWKATYFDFVPAEFSSRQLPVPTRLQADSKRDNWKRDIKDWDYILQQTGTSRIPNNGGIVASSDQWERFLSSKRGANMRKFRTKGVEREEDLRRIFSGTYATGRYATPNRVDDRTILSPDPDQEEVSITTGTGSQTTFEDQGTPDQRANKRARLTQTEGIERLAVAFDSRTQVVKEVTTPLLTRAIQLLQREYSLTLTRSQFQEAIRLLRDEANTQVFMGLDGTFRNDWLFNELGIIE